MPSPSDSPPEYKKYRSGPSFLRRGPRPGESLLDDFRDGGGQHGGDAPPPPGQDGGGRGSDRPGRPRL
ncbi:MAG TPA: hypothetical protein VI318_04945, partial [Baekduia sp.]